MIQKYQYGNPLLQSNHKRRGKINTWVNRGVKQVGMQAKQAEDKIQQSRKADARANRKTKVPMKSNNLSKLQEDLWKIGAFKGIKDRHGREATYNTAVNGIEGNMTRTAIANAKKMGYTINSNGILQQQKTQKPQQQVKPRRKNGLAEMYGMTHAATTGGMSQAVTPKNSEDPVSGLFHTYINNLYPYGYSDNEGKDTFGGVIKKGFKGLFGRSDKKSAVDEFVELDLNDPKQRARAAELRKNFANFGSNDLDYIQQGMRARLDANSLWANKPQRWDTWMENPDYQSPTAKAAGAKTYTYRDPKLRKRQQQLALAYSKQQKSNGVYPVKNDVLNTFNNYSINRMHDDGSGRYLEKWDFMGVDIPGSKGVYIGDTIPTNVGGRNTFVTKGDDLSFKTLLKNQFKKK